MKNKIYSENKTGYYKKIFFHDNLTDVKRIYIELYNYIALKSIYEMSFWSICGNILIGV